MLLSVIAVAALAGCGTEPAAAPSSAIAVDPATRLALEAPLLVDPALGTQSHRFAVLSDPAPLDGSLPLDDFAPVTQAAARAEALALAGKPSAGELAAVPCAACTEPTLALRAAVLDARCSTEFVAALEQGARMPEDLPIFPRAHLREAGAANAGCTLKAASFTAPVAAGDALQFYRALAERSGFTLDAARSGTVSALLGQRDSDGARFAVIARPMPGRLSEIDLITSGL